MDEHIGAAGEPVQGRAVGEASGYYVHILIGEEARPRRIARQHSNVVSPGDERGRDVAAHEPRASRQCDEHEIGAASAATQVGVPPLSSRNTSVPRRPTIVTSASYTVGSSTVPERSAIRCTAWAGLVISFGFLELPMAPRCMPGAEIVASFRAVSHRSAAARSMPRHCGLKWRTLRAGLR